MEKLVVKTATKTVLIILGLCIAVFAVFNFAFPQYMATATESIGNYSLAVKYASLRYSYTKKCEDLARCFDDSVLLGDDKYVLEYGEKLIAHNDYEEVCKARNEERNGSRYDYDHWVKSKLCVSMYSSGRRAEAINMALEDNGAASFPYGNALMSLAAKIKSNKDAEGARAMLDALKQINPVDQTEKDYLTQVIASMNGVGK